MFEGVLSFVNLKKDFNIKRIIGFKVSDNIGVNARLADEIKKIVEKYHGRCHIIIEPPYKPRTTGKFSQSNKFHGILRQIAQETGNDIETLKRECKRLCIERYDYPCDKVEKNGVEYLIPYSESKLNTQQESWLIESAEWLASEAGIILKY